MTTLDGSGQQTKGLHCTHGIVDSMCDKLCDELWKAIHSISREKFFIANCRISKWQSMEKQHTAIWNIISSQVSTLLGVTEKRQKQKQKQNDDDCFPPPPPSLFDNLYFKSN